ncbi:hypothetical protein F6A13_01640 [Acidithiobacillus sp. 'AMD consortium']|jgi:hypothetical protein|uniref:Uncharacterized protein n=2 Tax=Acidithiobacillus ferridurans TaxID=1232575 RepID=A0A2Z6IHL5_ACIFI|nr:MULTISPECIES: hypothetical protein [Acidithiobacillus]MBU2715355.1 hypothetical protein [Acidithiobacillus ferridurans]MBU2724225.1 hypothetical protein [Acidithiobacillus ferridurans]MBU2726847.1 hypothetical protein [Acidithiobacillus ferridurans]QFG77483.1 hypothetical protein F6A13_01640 [Acidithiobacillus sp. 'AMD consortium']RBM02466.1 hypothetical protein C3R74_05975 [Acidithiobacillus ferridurans]
MSKKNTVHGVLAGMRRGGGGGGRGRGQGGIRFGNEPGMRPAGMSLADEEAMEQRMLVSTGNTDKRARHQHDQEVFHTLLRHHDQIQRELTRLPDGIRSLTTSANPEIVSLLHDHVPAMHHRLEENFGLRFWDPAFPEIFAQREKVQMEVTLVPNGVLVEETSEDPNVVTLIQAHGIVVSLFVQRGFAQAQEVSPLPDNYQRVLGG